MVSAEPFPHGTGTLRCLQKEMATYRHWSVSLWWDPDDVLHCWILSSDKTEWRLISATLCGWGRCFVADQLWLRTRIREEEELWSGIMSHDEAVGSIAVRAACLRWSASLGSRPRLAWSLYQVIAAYALRLNSRAGTEGSTVSNLWLLANTGFRDAQY